MILYTLWRTPGDAGLLIAVSSAAFGFFILAPAVHENHLFYIFPVLALTLGVLPKLRSCFVILSMTFMMNMLLHDPNLAFGLKLFQGADRLLLPQVEHLSDVILEFYRIHGLTAVCMQAMGECSTLWLSLTMTNSAVQVCLFLLWSARLYTCWVPPRGSV